MSGEKCSISDEIKIYTVDSIRLYTFVSQVSNLKINFRGRERSV